MWVVHRNLMGDGNPISTRSNDRVIPPLSRSSCAIAGCRGPLDMLDMRDQPGPQASEASIRPANTLSCFWNTYRNRFLYFLHLTHRASSEARFNAGAGEALGRARARRFAADRPGHPSGTVAQARSRRLPPAAATPDVPTPKAKATPPSAITTGAAAKDIGQLRFDDLDGLAEKCSGVAKRPERGTARGSACSTAR